jgi:hypothetical protein
MRFLFILLVGFCFQCAFSSAKETDVSSFTLAKFEAGSNNTSKFNCKTKPNFNNGSLKELTNAHQISIQRIKTLFDPFHLTTLLASTQAIQSLKKFNHKFNYGHQFLYQILYPKHSFW